MMMVTIGDLYKFQPIVITSLTVNIPEDASWETLNEKNSNNWSYLNGLITAPNPYIGYGQLPREAEIAVTCNLLEKERAIMGGSHFGHAPRVDNWENLSPDDVFLTRNVPYLLKPTSLHERMVVFNSSGAPVATTETMEQRAINNTTYKSTDVYVPPKPTPPPPPPTPPAPAAVHILPPVYVYP
jgi:hypothetical protein